HLWAGTYGGGACRLDGDRFTCFDGDDGLANPFVNVLHVDRAGTLWAGTDGGLSRWNGQRFTTTPGSPRYEVKALAEDAGGTLWIGTSEGLFRLAADAAGEPPSAL